MKTVLSILAGITCGALGSWFMSSQNSVEGGRKSTSVAASHGRSVGGKLAKPTHGSSLASLAAIRKVPGAAAEMAWVKWAFSIADADVPAAIAGLNPNADFHGLRVLYARWAKLDFPTAWASLQKSKIAKRSQSYYIHDATDIQPGQSTLVSSPRGLIAGRMLHTLKHYNPAEFERQAALNETSNGWKQAGVADYETKRLNEKSPELGPPDTVSTPSREQQAASLLEEADSSEADVAEFLRQARRSSRDDESPLTKLTSQLRSWYEADPSAALQWAKHQEESPQKPLLLGEAAGRLAMTDLAAAQRMVAESAAPATALQAMVGGWMDAEPGKCLGWIDTITDADTANLCRAKAAWFLSGQDPMKAAAQAAKLPSSEGGPIFKHLLETVRWSPAAESTLEQAYPEQLKAAMLRMSDSESGG